MDLSSISRIQSSLAAPTGQLATRRPSTIKAQKLGLKFSSLNGKSVQEVVEVTRRRVKCSATGRKANSNVRSEQIDVTPTSVQTIERRMVTDRNVAQEIVTLKGKLVLSRTIGSDKTPECSFNEFQKNVWFTLVSTELDEQGKVKTSARTQMQDDCDDTDEFYEIAFSVPSDFGEPGALMVDSSNSEEFFLMHLDLKSADSSEKYEFACNSWINQKNDENYKIISFKDQYRKCFNNENLCFNRIFFTNKTYLPKDTPVGLKQLRALEMEALRGDGTGERKWYDRVYDYDVYNDLGNPEAVKGKPEVKAPIIRKTLGGPGNIPYPRRCRTGRRVDKATCMETLPPLLPEPNPFKQRVKVYVPRDEDFSKVKASGFQADSLQGVIFTLLPQFQAKADVTPDDFDTLLQVFDLYKDGLDLFSGNLSVQLAREERRDLETVLHNCLVKKRGIPQDDGSNIKYPTPQVIEDEPMQWIHDEEFGRQTLSGINPGVIRRAEVFPPKSDLPEDVYGPGTALIAQHIEPYLNSKGKKLTVAEAIAQKRLFTIDYHDVFLPYVNCINSQTDTKRFLYAPRAFFFLTDDQKMKPVAIELSLPPPQFGENKPCNRVFTPPMGGHRHDFEWELAKVHFSSVDFGYHELVSHWMQCHAVMEPFIIASHRQLSAMHPIFVLLDPCFVNTMRINANARASLIAAAPVGTIEVNFTPGQYGNELSAVAYDKLWRFDKVGLPEDLLERGMAVADYSKPAGVKLLFDDYPFAKDALDVWNATRDYITSYVKLFYTSDEMVWQDEELQAWWKEIREVGHGDKKDADWWPSCKTVESLIEILCKIFWIAGPQHASVNFGQYAYPGFMPSRPSMTRMPIPIENTPEYKEMLFNFEKYMLRVASSPVQTVTTMTTLHVLSSHAKDEEYIGSRLEENWTSNPKVQEVFSKYAQKVCGLELMFHQRNRDPKLKNRLGALKTPGYTLMYPTSEPGVTGMGVPWSVSI